MASALDIISLAEYKDRVKLEGVYASDDTLLENLITAVSETMEDYCGRYFVERATIETISGNDLLDRKVLRLKYTPVSSIESLVVDDVELVEDTDFTLSPNYGKLFLDGDALWALGRKNIVVNYTAGYAQSEFPERLKIVCAALVKLYYDHTNFNNAGVSSQTIAGQSISYRDIEIPSRYRMMLDSFVTGIN